VENADGSNPVPLTDFAASDGLVAVAVALGLVTGGAVGNLADRIFRAPGLLRGAVVDFVDLRWWPVFNVGDMAITAGCILLVLLSFSRERSATGR